MRLPIRRFSALLHTHQLPSLALSLTHAALAVRGNHHPSADARSRTDSVVTVSTYPVVVSSLPPFPPTTLAPRFLEGTPDCLAFQSLPSSTQASRRWLIIHCNVAPAYHGDSHTACDNDLFSPDATRSPAENVRVPPRSCRRHNQTKDIFRNIATISQTRVC